MCFLCEKFDIRKKVSVCFDCIESIGSKKEIELRLTTLRLSREKEEYGNYE